MPTTWLTGQKSSIGGTALALTSRTITPLGPVKIKADAANGANLVYVGRSGLTAGAADATSGFELAAGKEMEIPPNVVPGGLLENLYVIGSTTGLAVFWECYGTETT